MTQQTRILFIGELHSSHAQSWIDLLSGNPDFVVAGTPITFKPENLPFTSYHHSFLPEATKVAMLAHLRPAIDAPIYRLLDLQPFFVPYSWQQILDDLCAIIWAMQDFAPHVVHTFGFTPAALVYDLLSPQWKKSCKWVLQTRGGSDTAFHTSLEWQEKFRTILPQADAVICDNEHNYRFFEDIGAKATRHPSLSNAPGTGGMEIPATVPPIDKRRPLLVWPKAYECQWSKAIPVLEGLAKAMNVLPHITAILTACHQTEVRDWLNKLPSDVVERIEIRERIPREDMLAAMSGAQVCLMPSLVDGVPNTLYEACITGAIPVVSPLPTITPFFDEGANVFYARNLYPDEITHAIIKAFTTHDHAKMQTANLNRVKKLADRNRIRADLTILYTQLAVEDNDIQARHTRVLATRDEMCASFATLRTRLLAAHEELTNTQEEQNHTKDELSRMKEELNCTKNELSRTQDELSRTQDELSRTQDELSRTQDELSRTQDELSRTQDELSRTREAHIVSEQERAKMAEHFALAQQTLNHPAIRLQRQLWKIIRFWR